MIIFHLSFDIFHLNSHLPLGEGLGVRVRSIEKEKNRVVCLVLAKPSPNPLPKGEGVKMANENCQMTNGKSFLAAITLLAHYLASRFLPRLV